MCNLNEGNYRVLVFVIIVSFCSLNSCRSVIPHPQGLRKSQNSSPVCTIKNTYDKELQNPPYPTEVSMGDTDSSRTDRGMAKGTTSFKLHHLSNGTAVAWLDVEGISTQFKLYALTQLLVVLADSHGNLLN